MKNLTLTLLLALFTSIAHSQDRNDLFISEIVFGKIAAFDGANQENYSVEIFNPTDNSINLSDYKLDLFTEANVKTTFDLTGTIASKETFVVSYSNSGTQIINASDALFSNLKLDDYVLLELSNSVKTLDVIGKAGISTDISEIDLEALLADPEGYLSGININLRSVENLVIRRSPLMRAGKNSFEAIDLLDEWTVYPHFFIENLGEHVNSCVAPFMTWKDVNSNSPEQTINEGSNDRIRWIARIEGEIEAPYTIVIDNFEHEYSTPSAANADYFNDTTFDPNPEITIPSSNDYASEVDIDMGGIIDDNIIEGNEGMSFVMSVFNDNGTGASVIYNLFDILITDNDVSSVKNAFSTTSKVKSYPALVSDIVTIETTTADIKLEELVIYSMSGELLDKHTLGNSSKETIDLSSIGTSGYLNLIIRTSEGLAVNKIIKL